MSHRYVTRTAGVLAAIAFGAVTVAAIPERPPPPPPPINSRSCSGHQPGDACAVDASTAGTCIVFGEWGIDGWFVACVSNAYRYGPWLSACVHHRRNDRCSFGSIAGTCQFDGASGLNVLVCMGH